MKVEILYFWGCPNHIPAVDRVREVLEQEGTSAEMVEVEVQDAARRKRSAFSGHRPFELTGGR